MLQRLGRFYLNGFRSMRLGKTLWKLVLLKLFVLFAILKTCFFPDLLATRFATDQQRSDYVFAQLTQGAVHRVIGQNDNQATVFSTPSAAAGRQPSEMEVPRD